MVQAIAFLRLWLAAFERQPHDYAPAERCKVHCATSVGAAGTPPSTARSISGLGLSPLISRLHPPRSDPDAACDLSTPRGTFAVVDPLLVGRLAAQPLFTGPGRLWFPGIRGASSHPAAQYR
jgi:hypothetical protein